MQWLSRVSIWKDVKYYPRYLKSDYDHLLCNEQKCDNDDDDDDDDDNNDDDHTIAVHDKSLPDDDDDVPTNRISTTIKTTLVAFAIISVGLLSTIIVMLVQTHQFKKQVSSCSRYNTSSNTSHSTTPPPSTLLHCGTSRLEALSLGCHFDLMSFSWLPTPCYDPELTAEFLALRDWKWYVDVVVAAATDQESEPGTGGTISITRSEAESAVHDKVFVVMDYHIVHCAYMWKKLHRALGKRWPVDSYIANYTHTRHCAEKLLSRGRKQGDDDDDSATRLVFADVQYHTCPGRAREVNDDEDDVLVKSVELDQDYY